MGKLQQAGPAKLVCHRFEAGRQVVPADLFTFKAVYKVTKSEQLGLKRIERRIGVLDSIFCPHGSASIPAAGCCDPFGSFLIIIRLQIIPSGGVGFQTGFFD
jgi:hypothetical protein